MQAFFLGGLMTEDERSAGRSRLMAQMLTRGTKTRSMLEIARTFDNLGGRIGGGSGKHTVYLQADVLAEDFSKAFDVFADCVVSPAFPDDELAKVKTLTLRAIARKRDDWHSDAFDRLREALFTKSPYRLDALGTASSVKGLTDDDLRAFHRKSFVGKNGVIAVFGDVDPAKVRKAVIAKLGALPAGKSLLPETLPSALPLEKDVEVHATSRRPGTAVVYWAYPTCAMRDLGDRYALLVLDGVMSGINLPGGWLHTEMRGKGLVYVVHAYNALGMRSPGYFAIYALTQPSKVDETKAIVDKYVDKAKTGLVAEDEFERAKQMAITTRLLNNQTNHSLAMSAGLDELYGFGYDFDDRFEDRVRAVTREDLRRVAKKYFTHRVVVVVAPGEEEK
jgi:zinc protease